MKKIAVIVTLGVAVCFVTASVAQAGPNDPITEKWAYTHLRNKKRAAKIPIWQITQDGSALSVKWVSHLPNPRFAIYDTDGNNTSDPSTWVDDVVLDKETGLIWERSPNRNGLPEPWYGALSWAYGRKRGGRYGWRLPTIEELASLGGDDPSGLPTGHPFINVELEYYWTSTTYVHDITQAWAAKFAGTPDFITYLKTTAFRTWSVRGGSGDTMFAPLPSP